MSVPRRYASVTQLPDGRILVAGGDDGRVAHRSAELFDPSSGQWTAAGEMSVGRTFHAATLLEDGRVLVTGGFATCSPCDSVVHLLSSAEVFDPQTRAWSSVAPMAAARAAHTAALRDDGTVLVTSSMFTTGTGSVPHSEALSPAGEWSATPAPPCPRTHSAPVVLPGGRLLLTGGFGECSSFTSFDLLDASGRWERGALTYPRMFHGAALLSSGRVLIAGGGRFSPADAPTAELLDVDARVSLPAMAPAHLRYEPSLLPMRGGAYAVLVGGYGPRGEDVAPELYDEASGRWVDLPAARFHHGGGHVSAPLRGGRLLLAGGGEVGFGFPQQVTAAAELLYVECGTAM